MMKKTDKCARKKSIFGFSLVQSGFKLSMLLLSLHTSAFAQFSTFVQNINLPVGIETTTSGNLLVSHDLLSYTAISTFDPNAQNLGHIRVGNGIVDVEAMGHLAKIPSSESVFTLFGDGRLGIYTPSNASFSLLGSLRSVNADVTSVYDMASQSFRNMGGIILPQVAFYGDIAVYEEEGKLEVFATGISVAHPFVMRLSWVNENYQGAKVIVSTFQTTAPNSNIARGIAVNQQGLVVTTLPYSPTTAPFDTGVAFPVDFSTLPQFFMGRQDMASRGMTTDNDGNFYIATGSIGTTLKNGGSGALVAFNATLSQYSVFSLATPASIIDSYDIAISPDGHRLYMNVVNQKTILTMPTPSFNNQGGGSPNLTFDFQRSNVQLNGSVASLSLDILNSGNGNLGTSSAAVNYYVYNGRFRYLGRQLLSNIPAGGIERKRTTINLNNYNLEPGNYFMVAYLKVPSFITESNTGDNLIYWSRPMIRISAGRSTSGRSSDPSLSISEPMNISPYLLSSLPPKQTPDWRNALDGYPLTLNDATYTSDVPTDAQVSIYPNPAVNHANLSLLLTSATEVDIKVRDSSGRLVYQQSRFISDAGKQRLPLKTSNWAAGIYYYQVKIGAKIHTGKLSIIK